MKEQFRNIKLDGAINMNIADKGEPKMYWKAQKRDIINSIIEVCNEYRRGGYVLTLRQLYYQLVGKDLIPNKDKVYKKLSSLKDEVVYSGMVDWDVFEDRGRVPSTPYYENSIADALSYTADGYRLNRQKNQKNHVEVWTEKDAISSILKGVTSDYGITLVVNKGYTSSTAIYGAYKRFFRKIAKGEKVTILYFGDHDPSGLDMIRDIRDRLMFMFVDGERKEELEKKIDSWAMEIDEEDGEETYTDICWSYHNDSNCKRMYSDGEEGFCYERAYFNHHFQIIPIGLTMEQIEQYNPPPNPAKVKDPRAKAYVDKFGAVSWEVDALKPSVMEDIVQSQIELAIDMDVYNDVIADEEQDREKIAEIVKSLNDES